MRQGWICRNSSKSNFIFARLRSIKGLKFAGLSFAFISTISLFITSFKNYRIQLNWRKDGYYWCDLFILETSTITSKLFFCVWSKQKKTLLVGNSPFRRGEIHKPIKTIYLFVSITLIVVLLSYSLKYDKNNFHDESETRGATRILY